MLLSSSFFLLLVISGVLCDSGNDNKATESDPTGSLAEPPLDKDSKVTEKRAPIHLTAVPGMNTLSGIASQPYPYKYYLDSSLPSAGKSQLLLKSSVTPTPTYQSYVTLPQTHIQSPVHSGFNFGPMLVLMAAQHPSGYTMLIPATLIPHPMSMLHQQSMLHQPSMYNYMYLPQYNPTPTPVYNPPLPTKSYSTGPKSSNYGQLSANAGFAAQHQLLYSAPGYEATSTGSDSTSSVKASPEPFSNRLRGLEPYIKGR